MSSTLRCAGLFLVFALLVAIGCIGGTSLRHENSPPSDLDSFKIPTDGSPLLLPVEIQGKRYPFLFKTGTSRTIYGPSLRPLLGKEILSKQVRMHARDITVSFCRPSAAKLGHLDLPMDSPVVCMDLGKMGEVAGEEISGCLGMDFLSKHVFRIDYDRGEVTFPTWVGSDPGLRVPVVLTKHLPHVMVELPGLHGREDFLLDVGSSGYGSGDLRKEAFDSLIKQGMLKPAGETLTELPVGTGKGRLGRVDSITLAGFRLEKLLFCEDDENVLGLNFLSRFVVTFDFPNKAIYLKKSRQYDRADVRDLSGLHILRRNGLTQVFSVEEGSSAARAGIKPQDVIVRMDDKNINEMSLSSIRRILCASGKKCRLRIRRGEKELEIEFVLQSR